MTRDHLYEQLAHILEEKKDLLTIEMIDILLQLNGRKELLKFGELEITNLAAYEHLFLNFKLYQSSHAIQRYHLHQFRYFMAESIFSEFNSKKIHKMNATKKLLYAIHCHLFPDSILPDVFKLMKLFLGTNFDKEIIKVLSIFLVATLRKDVGANKLNNARRTLQSMSSLAPVNHVQYAPKIILTSKSEEYSNYESRIRNELLEILLDLFCDVKLSGLRIKLFLANVNTRWFLMFFEKSLHPYTVVLGTRIIARIMFNQDGINVQRFLDCFVAISDLLKSEYSHVCEIYLSLLSIFYGVDVYRGPVCDSVASFSAIYRIDPTNKKRDIYPEALVYTLDILKKFVDIVSNWKIKAIKNTLENDDFEDILDIINEKSMQLTDFPTVVVEYLTQSCRVSEEVREAVCASEIFEVLQLLFFETIYLNKTLSEDAEIEELTELLQLDAILKPPEINRLPPFEFGTYETKQVDLSETIRWRSLDDGYLYLISALSYLLYRTYDAYAGLV